MKLKRFRAQIMVLQTVEIQATSLDSAATLALRHVKGIQFDDNDLPACGMSAPVKAKIMSVSPVDPVPLLPKAA